MNATATEAAPAAATKVAPKKQTVKMEDGRIVEFNVGTDRKTKEEKLQAFVKTTLVKVNGAYQDIDELPADQLLSIGSGWATSGWKQGDIVTRFDFNNGATRDYPLNPALTVRYLGHGNGQKMGDELAGEDAPDLNDWANRTDVLNDRLQAGEWTKVRAAGSVAGASILIQALIEYTTAAGAGKTAAEVREYIKDFSKADRDQLMEDKDIKPFVDKVRAERAAKAPKVDLAALKKGLIGGAAAAG